MARRLVDSRLWREELRSSMLRLSAPRKKVITLGYHDVVDDGDEDASGFRGRGAFRYKLTWPRFERHLEAIAAAGRTPTLVGHAPRTDGASAQLVLTFDDGGASALRVGERLALLGWPAYFFVIGRRLAEPAFIDADGVRALRAMGHAVGSHSWSHPPRMSRHGPKALFSQWKQGMDRLSEILQEEITVASVPGGYYARRVAEAAAAAGLEVLFTSEPKVTASTVNGCLVLGRYSVYRQTAPSTAAALAAGNVLPRARQAATWQAKKLAKAAAPRAYSALRAGFIKRL